MLRHSTKLTAGLGVITAGLLSTGIAYAAWTSTGSGSGLAASTGDLSSVITGVTPGADLYPGATKSIDVTVDNPNGYAVEVTSISVGSSEKTGTGEACIAGTVRSAARSGTDIAGTSNGALTQKAGGTLIAGKTGAANPSGTYVLEVKMSNTADESCKNKTFTLKGTTTDVDGVTTYGTGTMSATLRSAVTSSTGGNGF